ncbi:MAG: DNA-3-methyladenine glycosylase 2 family protein [Clostridia bacterium]|nr:DNA-3-methyladenine glycosylase 2 family protein [Clostridia bacterium]
MVDYIKKSNCITLERNCFDAALSVDCGQSFRWKKINETDVSGIAFGKALTFRQTEKEIIFFDTDGEDFEKIWVPYFDLERDYGAICESFKSDSYLGKAVTECTGIRILKQDSWEALCSFIISQNNNIPRIKGIVERLCVALGEPLGNGNYAFPSAAKIAEAGIDALAPLRAGFRAKYIIDAAEKVASGEVDFEKIYASPLDEGRDELIKIKGVGEKVAQCALLYGFGKVDAFPVDVWVKRIMAELYPDGLPECTNGVRGIAQQYLFHWYRTK